MTYITVVQPHSSQTYFNKVQTRYLTFRALNSGEQWCCLKIFVSHKIVQALGHVLGAGLFCTELIIFINYSVTTTVQYYNIY